MKLIMCIICTIIISGCGYYDAQSSYYAAYKSVADSYISAHKDRKPLAVTKAPDGTTMSVYSQEPIPLPMIAPPKNIFVEFIQTVLYSPPAKLGTMLWGMNEIVKSSTGDNNSVTTDNSQTAQPFVVKPEVVNPEVVNPEVVKPEIVNPEVVNPVIVKPEIIQPSSTNTPIIGNPLYPFAE